MVTILSWNVNGLRSFIKKVNMNDIVKKYKPDIICLQETKLNKEIEVPGLENYEYKYWNFSEVKKGYSGTVIFSKIELTNCRSMSAKPRDK